MKKRLIFITATIITVILMVTLFAGCSQSEEDYYASITNDIKEFNADYTNVLENLQKANFKMSFNFETNYNMSVLRGTTQSKGWDAFELAYKQLYDSVGIENPSFFEELFGKKSATQEALDELNIPNNAWVYNYTQVEYMQNTSSDYYLKVTTYGPIWEGYYEDAISAIADKTIIETELNKDANSYKWNYIKNVVENPVVVEINEESEIKNGIECLNTLVAPIVKTSEFSDENCYFFTNGNKIYTHVMQAQYIDVYKNTEAESFEFNVPEIPTSDSEEWKEFSTAGIKDLVDSWWQTSYKIFVSNLKVISDESLIVAKEENVDNKYWTGFGEDLSYNWENVGEVTSERFTYSYGKGNSKLTQIDYYIEYFKPHYTEKSAADATLELKASTYYSMHIIANIEYSDSQIQLPEITPAIA